MTATLYPIQSYILGIPLDVKLLNSKFGNAFEKSLLSGFYNSFSGKVLILGNANVGKNMPNSNSYRKESQDEKTVN